jgi:hypothetical protein
MFLIYQDKDLRARARKGKELSTVCKSLKKAIKSTKITLKMYGVKTSAI